MQDPKDLISRAALVSKHWRDLATSQAVWQVQFGGILPSQLIRAISGGRQIVCSGPPWPALWTRLYKFNLLQGQDWGAQLTSALLLGIDAPWSLYRTLCLSATPALWHRSFSWLSLAPKLIFGKRS